MEPGAAADTTPDLTTTTDPPTGRAWNSRAALARASSAATVAARVSAVRRPRSSTRKWNGRGTVGTLAAVPGAAGATAATTAGGTAEELAVTAARARVARCGDMGVVRGAAERTLPTTGASKRGTARARNGAAALDSTVGPESVSTVFTPGASALGATAGASTPGAAPPSVVTVRRWARASDAKWNGLGTVGPRGGDADAGRSTLPSVEASSSR